MFESLFLEGKRPKKKRKKKKEKGGPIIGQPFHSHEIKIYSQIENYTGILYFMSKF